LGEGGEEARAEMVARMGWVKVGEDGLIEGGVMVLDLPLVTGA
jgi:hypothetical protein